MAILNIRNLPDDVHAALRIKAAQAGLSMEAEARRILADACLEHKPAASAKKLQDLVQTLYGKQKPIDVTDEQIRLRRVEAKNE
jgi:plasmid stability protein